VSSAVVAGDESDKDIGYLNAPSPTPRTDGGSIDTPVMISAHAEVQF
jgi:hypothetical protein